MKNKLTFILLLLSKIIITSPEKITKKDLQKTIIAFQQFKFEYECDNPERISLFSSEDMRSKHKCYHNNSYMPQIQHNLENIQRAEEFKKLIPGEQ